MTVPHRLLPLLLLLLIASTAHAGSIKPLLPEPLPNDEAALLAAARAVEPVILDGGYRQYDLTFARVNTWDGPTDLKLRLFLPPGAQRDLPLVVYVHGGGFIGGSYELNLLARRGFNATLRALVDDGFAVASVGYRLAREAGWPAPISDPMCGLRFLTRHGNHWGINPQPIGLTGHSAGARIVALMATVPQDDFHNQTSLPWQNTPVNIGAVWLWAGSPLTASRLSEWEEFGKPRNYSVPRLLFGEHPAWHDDARHRLRIRNNLPHLSAAVPPMYLLRGASDYGGDHRDAEQAVEIWKALGGHAELSIVPGGHNAAGPTEATAAFFNRWLRQNPPAPRQRDHESAARTLLDAGLPMAALEVLTALHTTEGGTRLPAGRWMFRQDESLFWLPELDTLTESQRTIALAARSMLAEEEAEAAARWLGLNQWFRAKTAAENVLTLVGDQLEMQQLTRHIPRQTEQEKQVFQTLRDANQRVHGGRTAEAVALLIRFQVQQAEGHDQPPAPDARIAQAIWNLNPEQSPEPLPELRKPAWAASAGRDVYGIWADLPLDQQNTVRLRWVAPGAWDIPEHLRFRNRVTDPWVSRITIEHGFWLAETATTRVQWQALNPAGDDAPNPLDARSPISRIDYLQIVDWLSRLSDRHEELIARLPTEEEWLHAGTLGGRLDTQASIDLHAFHALNVDREHPQRQDARTLLPSLGGFYGLVGGVQEWTSSPSRLTARFNDERGRFRVLAYPIARGGAWSGMPHVLGWDARSHQRHGNRQPDLGFRIAVGGGPDAANWLSNVEQ